MRRLAIAAAMISCGKAPVARPVPPRPAPPPAVAKVTCARAGAVMKTDTTTADDLTALCTSSRWSDAVLACLDKAPDIDKAYACLGALTADQKVAYAELAANGTRASVEQDDAPSEAFVACEDGIHETNLWDPAPVHGEEENVELLAAMRKRVLVRACNADEWDGEVRSCLGKAHDRAATNSCAAKLPPDKLQHAGTEIARVDGLLEKTIAGERKPPTCAALVAKHYGDAAWKGKLADVKPADRAKLIAQSRAQMLKTCGGDKWDAQIKACLFVGGDADCFADHYDWTFPAVGIAPASTGVPECDSYLFSMAAIDKCTKLPASSRDAMRDAMAQMKETFIHLRSLPADQRAAMGESCKYGAEALQSLLQQVGC